MNRLLTVALTVSLLVINPAFADDWHGNNGGGHGPNHGDRPPYHPGPPPYHPAPPPYHPALPPKPYYGYYPAPHKNNNNKTEWPAYLAGGVILGALLTNMFQGSRPTAYYDNSQQTPPNTSPGQGRRLFRDANGNCYERQTDGYGNELSNELPPAACNW
ncbi:MAG TPA: hypothetical protein VFG38_07630 [Pseudomonadales bacterium]|nr:hypothetical protein [Pseudomonadales bacterium]